LPLPFAPVIVVNHNAEFVLPNDHALQAVEIPVLTVPLTIGGGQSAHRRRFFSHIGAALVWLLNRSAQLTIAPLNLAR
jgi:hypothetical protein